MSGKPSANVATIPHTCGNDSKAPAESHECPEWPVSPKSPVFPVSPVSEGQGLEKELAALAVSNACTREGDDAESKLFKFARDVRGLEKALGQKLPTAERTQALNQWYYLSEGFLDATKTRDDYLADFLKKLGQVRVPTGAGDTLNKAIEAVSKLSSSELPIISGMYDAPESWRRILGLHSELSRRSVRKDKTHFLTCRDAAKAVPGMNHQTAWNINGALAELGVIKVVRAGDARPGGKGSQYLYLLSQESNGAAEIAA